MLRDVPLMTVVCEINFHLCTGRILGGSTGEGDTDASKENWGCIRTVVNPYKCNGPRKKLSYNTPLLLVRNPYKKRSSQKETDTKQLSSMTHGLRVSTYYELH